MRVRFAAGALLLAAALEALLLRFKSGFQLMLLGG